MDRASFRLSLSLVAVAGVAAATLAAATIWLLITDPVIVSTTTTSGDVGPFVRAVGNVILEALRGLFNYL
ncbi:MAG: hypothetical protein ABI634_03400 [Acidobacteriota bacterium]